MPINILNSDSMRAAVSELARELDAAPHGERGRMIAHFAAGYGWSRMKVYRELRGAGWLSGRKRRADAGASGQSLESLVGLTGLTRASIRKNGKPTLHTPTARSILHANGVEFSVGNARINTLLKQRQMDLAAQCRETPYQAQRSLYPNHVHQVDPSLCLIYYLPGGDQGVLRDDEIYKNKPDNIERLGDLKVWRYVLTDHYSNTIIVRYYQARGETQANLFDFLLYCWSRREGRVFHGVPKALYWDKGSANMSGAIRNALRALDVTPLTHEAGNPRSKGSVEVAQNIIETHFECRLKPEPVRNIDELNQAAERWYNAWNADCIPGYDARLKRKGMNHPVSRYGLWQTIRQDQLLLLPELEVCRFFLTSDPKERQVRADMTVSFKHPAAARTQYYDLAGLPNVYPRATVRVSPLIYRACAVLVYVADYLGEEQSFVIDPVQYDAVSGFRLDAAIIGEQMKSQPDTPVDKAAKAADRAAFPGKTQAEIKKAREKNAAPFAGRINAHSHLADVVPPTFMQRPGTDLDVPDRARPELKPLTVTEACKRLVLELGPAPRGVNYYDIVRAWYPAGVPDAEFQNLLARVRGDDDTTQTGATREEA